MPEPLLFLTFASHVNETLIIVPTVNERENLPRLAAKLLSLPVKVDLLVVDGNSSDGTAQIADELAAKHPEIHIIVCGGGRGEVVEWPA